MCGQAYSIDVIRLANQGWTSQHAHRKGMDNFHFLSPNRGIDTEGVHESRFRSSQSDALSARVPEQGPVAGRFINASATITASTFPLLRCAPERLN